MKRHYLFYFFLCIHFFAAAQQQLPNFDVLHYRFALTVNDSTNQIEGNATITIVKKDDARFVNLNLVNIAKDGKGMQVTACTLNQQPLSYVHQKNLIYCSLTSPFKKGDTMNIKVQYKGTPIDGFIISANKYGHRTFFSDNWPNRAQHWLPCRDTVADKATVEFIVTAPNHYQIVSNGICIDSAHYSNGTNLYHWKETQPIAPKVMAVGIANFAIDLSGYVGHVPVSSWVFPENHEAGKYDYGLAIKILPFFIEKIAPYPFAKLANVQSKTIFGGMENAGCIFYAEGSVTGDQSREDLLAHEIAHQWFGNMATENNYAHLWLSEGFATYFTHLYLQNKYGGDTLVNGLKEDRAKIIRYSKINTNPVMDTLSKNYLSLLNPNSYDKGSWVLHMLHVQLGDAVFYKIIKTYYNRFAGKNCATADFQKVAETISKQKLQYFFNQWIYTSSQPKLEVKTSYNAAQKSTLIQIIQKQQKLFAVPLTVDIVNNGKTIRKKLPLKNKITNFRLKGKIEATAIHLDPKTELLFEKFEAE
ncbi:MAG: M1 family metallopeptidase [Ferruginibacter sp.]